MGIGRAGFPRAISWFVRIPLFNQVKPEERKKIVTSKSMAAVVVARIRGWPCQQPGRNDRHLSVAIIFPLRCF
jgi:hypothetical protein